MPLSQENKVIPERSLVLGSPGKIVRQVTEEEIKSIKENAEHYVANYKKNINRKFILFANLKFY